MSAAAYFNLFLAFLVAALLSFVLTPPVKTLAGRIGAVDVPKDARRMHHVPIPRLGGLAIFLAFLLTTLLFCEITAELRGQAQVPGSGCGGALPRDERGAGVGAHQLQLFFG